MVCGLYLNKVVIFLKKKKNMMKKFEEEQKAWIPGQTQGCAASLPEGDGEGATGQERERRST